MGELKSHTQRQKKPVRRSVAGLLRTIFPFPSIIFKPSLKESNSIRRSLVCEQGGSPKVQRQLRWTLTE